MVIVALFCFFPQGDAHIQIVLVTTQLQMFPPLISNLDPSSSQFKNPNVFCHLDVNQLFNSIHLESNLTWSWRNSWPKCHISMIFFIFSPNYSDSELLDLTKNVQISSSSPHHDNSSIQHLLPIFTSTIL